MRERFPHRRRVAGPRHKAKDFTLNPPPELPRIAGPTAVAAPGATQPDVSGALAVISLLTPDLRTWLTAVDATDSASPAPVPRNGIRVGFGSQAHLADKVVDLATVLTRVDLTDLAAVDLSVVHTPVLTRTVPTA